MTHGYQPKPGKPMGKPPGNEDGSRNNVGNHDRDGGFYITKDLLIARIRELAMVTSPDYPNVENTNALDHLWAIRCAYEGTNKANADLHKLLNVVMEKYGITTEEILNLWDETRGK